MKRKIIYRSVDVQQVRVAELLPLLVAGCIVAMDVAKEKFVVALATLAGEVVKLVRFQHPTQTRAFLAVVEELRAALGADKVVAAMEPTGTYGDAVRLQLVRAGVPVHMVSPKRTHDSKELFDGVPSLHDPKSAVLVAKLESMQLSTPWSEPPATRVRLRALVDARQHQRAQEEMSFGRLEAALARHWPEHGQWMDVREQMSALRLLVEYPSPARVAKEPEKARSLLRSASRGRLSVQAIEGVITGAKETLGVPMVAEEEQLVSMLATSLISARQCAESLERQMLEVAKDDEVFLRLARWMGTYTAAVIVTHVDPRQYSHAPQLEKACGMNLREKSSGESNGRLSLTKRGPGVVRQVLYMFALRMIQESAIVRAWYQRRRGYSEQSRMRAIVAVMRKLVGALFHVARGQEFDATKLFDVRRLELEQQSTTASTDDAMTPASLKPAAPTPRTTPRPSARGTKRSRATGAAQASA